MKKNKSDIEKESQSGFAIFKKILDNKRKIEKALKEGKSLTEIKEVKIAKPLWDIPWWWGVFFHDWFKYKVQNCFWWSEFNI